MSSICLCMIVRDEAEVIERLLVSVHDLIDAWVICDTGSTDGTPALIRRALADVPGTLHERPWQDFGHNRTELVRLAHGAADYLLLLDADMTLVQTADLPHELVADSYMVRSADGELEYWNKRLVRGDRIWRYQGATHEYIVLDEGADGVEIVEPLEMLSVHHHADGGARSDKFERDKRLLERELADDVNNARAVFYLAQTYRDLGEREQALELYERRTAMGGWEEEIFYSTYQAGVIRADLGDWPLALATLIQAFELRPARAEPLYELSARLRLRGEYESAHVFASRGLGRPAPPDLLFVQPWVYEWGLLFEYSITAYWTGDTRRALAACTQLLRLPELPEVYRQQVRENRRFCEQRLVQIRNERGVTPTQGQTSTRPQRPHE
jgi:tetratricopeptide (TPR) repeat protein